MSDNTQNIDYDEVEDSFDSSMVMFIIAFMFSFLALIALAFCMITIIKL